MTDEARKAYPLTWPDGWKRTASRSGAAFGKKPVGQTSGIKRLSVADAVQRVLYELERMGLADDDVIVSTNVRLRLDGMPRSDEEPRDPGVAVYWQKKGANPRCMAIDRYTRVADNLAAVAATLEAMRAIERHGGATIIDRAFKGFAALPERATQHWRETLGVSLPNPTAQHIEERFRTLAKVHHPDKGGDRNRFEEIAKAREAALLEVA